MVVVWSILYICFFRQTLYKKNEFKEWRYNFLIMVPRGGIEPPTQGFSVILNIEQDDKFKKVLLAFQSILNWKKLDF